MRKKMMFFFAAWHGFFASVVCGHLERTRGGAADGAGALLLA